MAGTKIRTEHGLVDIEDIKVGDKVWSRNLATAKDELQPVVQTYIRHADSLLKLTIAGAVLTTTKDHPFWVQGKGWTQAGDLRVGDTLVTPGGATPLMGITPVAKGATVYNFQVASNHDYYVVAGQVAVLVHNAEYSNPFHGTSMTDEESLLYHYEEHGNGVSIEQYARDTTAFRDYPPVGVRRTPVDLADGTRGYRYQTGKNGNGPGGM